MRPDASVLLLTTLIGAGQGLFLALFTVQAYALFGLLPVQHGHTFYAHGSLVALVLLACGLAASFFHLGRPERAWRAASQWRTSWLSREVIVLPAFMAVVFLYGAAHLAGFLPVLATLPSGIAIDATVALGVAGTLLAFALFVCTGMIYACLPFLREWASPLTPINFTLMGGASGFTLAAAFSAAAAPDLVRFLAGWGLILTAARGRRARRVARPEREAAAQVDAADRDRHQAPEDRPDVDGLPRRLVQHPGVLPRPRPAVPAFGQVDGPGGGFALPAVLLAAVLAGAAPVVALAAAFALQFAGLLAERWYFFAEANHPQNLYYQAIA